MKKRIYTKTEIKKMKKIVREYKRRQRERMFIKIVESDFMFIINIIIFSYISYILIKGIVDKLFL